MKTLNFLKLIILGFVLIQFQNCKQQDIKPEDEFEGTEITFKRISSQDLMVIQNLDDKDQFREYFVIQFEKEPNLEQLENRKFQINESESYISLLDSEGNTIVFSVHEHNRDDFNLDSTYFNYVYGYSTRTTGNEPLTLNNDLVQRINSGITCQSGGEGSSQCSSESGFPMDGSCSTTCRSTHYACCDDTKNECKCIPNGT